jgi:hypothetical protein
MATLTDEQVTKMHTYLLKQHYHSVNGDDYADGQYRLQLRLLTLMLFRFMGAPKLNEVLSARYSHLKVYKCDLGSAQGDAMPPMGEPGTGPNTVLMVRFGPDVNGKDIFFLAMHHTNPNECCLNALGDSFLYEQKKDPARKRLLEWMINPKAVPPFVFHKPRSGVAIHNMYMLDELNRQIG